MLEIYRSICIRKGGGEIKVKKNREEKKIKEEDLYVMNFPDLKQNFPIIVLINIVSIF